eukprot:TRINITY_DN66180_c2_g2_i1.p1 TRINITY_DN66180_c2_g2~~TRINITY_DN66180_c2_g2_i1.p1  ORF type:complete len:190 (+),score=40.57 TRINITY_DN66180_c2_g2_i1:71-640(+)
MNKTFVLLLIISVWGTAVVDCESVADGPLSNQEEKKITDSLTATQQHTPNMVEHEQQPHHEVAQEEEEAMMIQQNLIEDLQQDIETLLQENARLSAQLSNYQTAMDKIVNDLAQKQQDTVNDDDATPKIQGGEKKSKYEECMGVCAARKKICKRARYLFCDDSYERCKKNCNIHKGDDPAEPGEIEPAT